MEESWATIASKPPPKIQPKAPEQWRTKQKPVPPGLKKILSYRDETQELTIVESRIVKLLQQHLNNRLKNHHVTERERLLEHLLNSLIGIILEIDRI